MEGANLSYQWLCRAPGASNFEYLTSSDATTNTLRVEMTAASNGAEYRCFITDANGDMGSTRVATVKLDILDWEMEYNASGIRTKRVSEEKTCSRTAYTLRICYSAQALESSDSRAFSLNFLSGSRIDSMLFYIKRRKPK